VIRALVLKPRVIWPGGFRAQNSRNIRVTVIRMMLDDMETILSDIQEFITGE
jgi:hypothetical protein